MTKTIDKRALTQWKKSSISYQNYQNYISNKNNKFELTFIDLLYVSNFKGGNATINEPEREINQKLKSYSKLFLTIEYEFQNLKLSNLSIKQINRLNTLVNEVCDLTLKKSEYKIDGFSISYLSALLNAYFPLLIPILDRRILINIELVTEKDRDKQDQIKDIQKFFSPLIKKMAEISKEFQKSIREIDRELFVLKITKN
ncbi:MAG: hypothetical protein ACWA45_04815 [Flavobacteriales bacterium]